VNRNSQVRDVFSNTQSLAETVGFDLLGPDLGSDLKFRLKTALGKGTIFKGGTNPLSIFRTVLRASIREIETHERGRLFQRFLRFGPYEGDGDVPPKLSAQRLTDVDTAKSITFIYSFMVNSFKGAVTELLAAIACQQLVGRMCLSGALPKSARLYVGDTVMILREPRGGVLKGADMHVLVVREQKLGSSNITLAGVVEVKSGHRSPDDISRQLERHILRAGCGLRVADFDYPAENVLLGLGPEKRIFRIIVQPSNWKLPRTFWFQNTERGRILHMERAVPPNADSLPSELNDSPLRIELKWSREAIAQAAYEMTFWYMEEVGKIIYSDKDKMPENWRHMTPAEAGRNAAKMMLYYAILRCRTARESQRAIALYNTYGFGYALGMHFKNEKGGREMLWPEDLDEILASGKTKGGCRIK
jgi:hypothetical protein